MRSDQYERLQKIEEKLYDIFLEEADPGEWSGAGIKMSAMDKQTRGDRYWCKRNAAATGALAAKVSDMIGKHHTTGDGIRPPDVGGEPEEDGTDLDRELQDVEREAARLIERMQQGGKITKGSAHGAKG